MNTPRPRLLRTLCHAFCAAVLVTTASIAQAAPPAPHHVAAGRLLTQGTFGPTRAEILRVARLSPEAWIDEQIAAPVSLHLPLFNARVTEDNRYAVRQHVWWERSVLAPDQLRQRVAFALSEILVVSDKSDIDAAGLTVYYDLLVRGAFGNFRDLLQRVTLSPAMGRYLSMLGNRKPDASAGIRADENFARELMQLFTLGLWQLNADGSQRLDPSGLPIPTYTQADVENLARIFTGWHWAGMPSFNSYQPNWTQPMQAYESFHDTDAKRFLGVNYVAGRSASTELSRALNQIFAHPNLGPFLGRQLIQRLVTSNPSPAYIARVSAAFNDNGQGVRGDLAAVIKAILLDPEARAIPAGDSQRYGKLREPMLRLTHLWRAFRATGAGPRREFNLGYSEYLFAQGPLTSPSVFNFFSPRYSPPGDLRAEGYVVPELQIVNESTLTRADNAIRVFAVYLNLQNPYAGDDSIRINLSYERSLAGNIPALLDHLDLVLMNGRMSTAQRQSITRRLGDYVPEYDTDWDVHRAAEAIYLVLVSPQYLVQQ